VNDCTHIAWFIYFMHIVHNFVIGVAVVVVVVVVVVLVVAAAALVVVE